MINNLVSYFLGVSDPSQFDYMLCIIFFIMLFDGFVTLIGVLKRGACR